MDTLQAQALEELKEATSFATLETFRVNWFGKKGPLAAYAAKMKDLSPEERPAFGQALNQLRQTLTQAWEEQKKALQDQADAAVVNGVDLSLPGRSLFQGSLHPLTQLLDEAIQVLRRLGFALAEGPEVETEWHCFDALNTPADHPARNEKDTFYLPDGHLLRSHTSTVQIRTMENAKELPVRIIAPGSAFRRDEIDATHLSAFHQLEGLYVAPKVGLADLKGTLEYFFRQMFGEKTELRLRPHFFPFTEPSYEIDIKLQTQGREARWIEVAGCGMVDPAVFQAVHERRKDDLFHPDKVTGFAFGMGLERLAMIRWGVPDIRAFIENDSRFLAQIS